MPLNLDSKIVYLMQLIFSLVGYGLLWAWLIGPYLRTRPVQDQFIWLIMPLLFQLVAMTTLVGTVVNRVETVFGWVVTACNLITIPLAILFGVALRKRWSSALLMGWVLTVVGFACGAATFYFGIVYDMFDKFGPHWYVGTYYVPLQATCHVLILITLLQRGSELSSPRKRVKKKESRKFAER